jgi:integrase
LQHVLDKIPTKNVLGGEDGQLMTRAKYNGLFRRMLSKAGLKGSGISQYTFRHNFCTECWYAGISIKECMRQMGHKDFRMILEVYNHLDASKENTKDKMACMVM